jgi:hypothetical protein
MRGISKILTGVTLAAGVFGAGAALAMEDGYDYRSTTPYYYETSPGTTYDSMPEGGYGHDGYAPSGTFGYYDNPYNPYWAYRGPLGQGSGSDMRIGR